MAYSILSYTNFYYKFKIFYCLLCRNKYYNQAIKSLNKSHININKSLKKSDFFLD